MRPSTSPSRTCPARASSPSASTPSGGSGSAEEASLITFIRKQLGATVGALKSFTGNARAVAVTEPLWGVPFNLFSTYTSVYMLALGCSATQIGLISSVGLVVSMVLSLAGGSITDRLGRRRTTVIFDLISWGGATLLWAFARNFTWFLIAAVVNSFVRIVQTSWQCLLVEDTPQGQRVHLYAWIYIVGIMAGLIAPLAGLFVEGFGLVRAMRGMYLFAFVLMDFMFLWRNSMVRETQIGVVKLKESRHATVRDTLADYARVAGLLAHSPLTLAAFLLSALVNIQAVLKTTFQAILLTKSLGFSDASIALFPAAGAVATLLIYLLVLPSLSGRRGILPLCIGIVASAAGVLLMAVCPTRSWTVVILSTMLTSAGAAIMIPHSDTLVANTVLERDRSKALSLFYVFYYALSAPWGYIAGLLFAAHDRLPFIASGIVLLLALLLCLWTPRLEKRQKRQEITP